MSEGEGFVRVGALAEVPEGELRAFELEGGRVVVAHLENEVFAFADACPADGCWLSEGELDEGLDALVCPCDGSRFDLRTGEPVEGPAVDAVPTFRVRVQDEWIEIGPEIGGPG